MASTPTYDPNKIIQKPNKEYWESILANTLSPLTNRSIQGLYSPGSTFKIIPMSAILELGIYAPDDSIYCEEGEYDISESYGLSNKRIIYDHDPYDTLSVTEIISNSSNIGISKIVLDLPDLLLYDLSLIHI